MPSSGSRHSTDLLAFQDRFGRFLLQRGEFDGDAAVLAIYRNNVMYSLSRALADQYPAVHSLVGEAFFGALARDYVLQYPPQDPSLTFYGECLGDYIRQHPACAELPWLADVAQLEFDRQRVLHAPDEAALDIRTLASLDAGQLESLRLPLLPSVGLMRSRWPVQRIRDEALSETPCAVDLHAEADTLLLIHRIGLNVRVDTLSLSRWRLLALLADHLSIAEGWERLKSEQSLADDSLVSVLSELLSLSVFAAVTPEP